MEKWNKCVEFHGHECGGLTIGYKAAMYAEKLLGLTFSEDEQVVCVSENDACGVDAIQVLLGCSVGKGNLLFHMTGKQAFSNPYHVNVVEKLRRNLIYIFRMERRFVGIVIVLITDLMYKKKVKKKAAWRLLFLRRLI